MVLTVFGLYNAWGEMEAIEPGSLKGDSGAILPWILMKGGKWHPGDK